MIVLEKLILERIAYAGSAFSIRSHIFLTYHPCKLTRTFETKRHCIGKRRRAQRGHITTRRSFTRDKVLNAVSVVLLKSLSTPNMSGFGERLASF